MRIARASLEPLRLTLRQPLSTARATYDTREGFRVRLEDEQGYRGWGEAMPLPGYGNESLSECRQGLEALLEAVRADWITEGLDEISAVLGPAPLEERPKGAPARTPWAHMAAARHAVELALLDLLARRRGVPLGQLFAEKPRPVVEVNALLVAATLEALAHEARQAVDEGYQTLKLKVGGRPLEEDEARLEAVRRAVGPQVRLRVDANGAWEAAEAERALGLLGRFSLELCEQPVAAARLDELAGLRTRVPCPLAADESLALPGAERALVGERSGVEVLVLKPMVLGGLLPALRLARRAWARGVDAYVTSSLDGVVARAGAAHLAAALPSGRYASGLGVGHLFVEEPAGHPYSPVAGRIRLSERPGLGWR